LTILNKTKIQIKIVRENPDLGPPLKFRLWLDNKKLSEHELVNTLDVEHFEKIDDGRHNLFIEHYDRDPKNTKINDDDGSIDRSSMGFIETIKINNIFFYAARGISINKFIPAYDMDFIFWAKKHRPGSNFPTELPAHPMIGQNGKLQIHFIWPLEQHGLYYGQRAYPCQPFIFGNRKDVEMVEDEGDKESPLKLYVRSDCDRSTDMNILLTKRQIKFHRINIDKDNKASEWFYARHRDTPQLYKNNKWVCDLPHLPFVSIDDLLE
jgi:glutaredoxin